MDERDRQFLPGLVYWYYRVKEFRMRAWDQFCFSLAWKLPKRINYWAAVRVFAHATSGRYAGEEVTKINVVEAMKRWSDRYDLSHHNKEV